MKKLSLGSGALAFAFALTFTLTATLVTLPADASTAHSSTVSRTTTIDYPGCPSGAVTVTVTVPRAPVPPGVPVHYRAILRNTGSQTCGPSNATTAIAGRDTSAGLELFGQCGTFPVVIEDRHGQRVYPPFLAILCPNRVAPKLSPGAQIITSQSWNQMEGGGRPARRAQLAPSGTYHVTINGTTRASFILAPRRRASTATAHDSARIRTPRHRSIPTTVTRSAHITFENCPTEDIVATVSIPARPVAGKPVSYSVTLRNSGATTCGPTNNAVSPGRRPLTVGPCGILPAVVRNTAGVDIYPGPVDFDCPAEYFIDLPAFSAVRAIGTWPGTQALGPAPPHVSAAPPGRYRIVVGNPASTVSVPFTLVAPTVSPTA